MGRIKIRRLWRLEVVIAASLVVMAMVTLISFYAVLNLLDRASQEDDNNQRLIEESISQATQALEQQLPLVTELEEALALAIRVQDEFELMVLDPNQGDKRLRQMHRRLIASSESLKQILQQLPSDLAYRIRENFGVLIDISEEVLETKESNNRYQLFRDTIPPLKEIQRAMRDTHALLEQQSLIMRGQLIETNLETSRALNTHRSTAHSITWLLGGTLGVIILLTVAAQAGFFTILYRRIYLLENFANRMARGQFPRPPFFSADPTGRLAQRLARMGRRIQTLLTRMRKDTQQAEQARAEAEQLAFYDPLTGLENRRLFKERLHNALQMVERHPEDHLALFYLDLDEFKRVNDTMGHDAGDQLLLAISKRLQLALRDEDSLARLGGDEFAMLVNCNEGDCAALAQRLLTVLHRPISIGDRELQISTSIGIAIAGKDGQLPQELLKNADLALYRAKELGRNNYQFYAEELNTQAHMRMEILAELRQAIPRADFQLFYQPKYCLKTDRLVGLEALIRWPHPEKGYIRPDLFIPLAEESGLITVLGEWILRSACQEAKYLEEAGNPVSVAINISARQFHDKDLVNKIRQVLYETGLSPHLLELEITETMLIEDIEQSILVLETLKRQGVTVAIDDFGTGFSSLKYLKQLPLDVLKIDRAFLTKACQTKQDAAVARTLIELGHRLNLKVVAEGVETGEQLEFLKTHGCDIGQGMLFSMPRPIEQLGLYEQPTAKPTGYF